jgi:hypothetical protein
MDKMIMPDITVLPVFAQQLNRPQTLRRIGEVPDVLDLLSVARRVGIAERDLIGGKLEKHNGKRRWRLVAVVPVTGRSSRNPVLTTMVLQPQGGASQTLAVEGARSPAPSVQLSYDLGEMARLALRLTTAEARQLAEALFAAADYGDG